ncbi:MAG: cytochrome c [Synechococcales bacterium]|nr:cytochrome c [Synechococcales bacterium]
MHQSKSSDRPHPSPGTKKKIIGGLVIVVVVILAWLISPFIIIGQPATFSDIDEHFRHGTIGGESTDGIPYWLWKALPAVFADKLPADQPAKESWSTFGFIQEPDHELPIGFAKSKRSIFANVLGIDVITQNCATCHVSTLRETPDSEPTIISTMPGTVVNLQAYIRFLITVAADERFTPSHIMPFISEMGANLNPLEKLVYKYFVIPQARDSLMRERHDLAVMDLQSDYGPGRVDTFNTYKTRRFGFEAEDLSPEEVNGIADFPSIWNQGPRQSVYLHWDGNNNNADERNRTAALALVAPSNLNFDSLQRLREWLNEVPPPAYPYAVDANLAAQGKPIFDANCARCHNVFDRPGADTVIPIDEIQTDRGRLDSYTTALAANQYLIFSEIQYRGEDKRFRNYRKTNGYVSAPLDGIWLRAPYLHNGSVPTMRDLLQAPADRPTEFYRGYDVYDQQNMGFVSTVAEENGNAFFKFDTTLPGNGNGGHTYGTELPADDKEALIEYLKTL